MFKAVCKLFFWKFIKALTEDQFFFVVSDFMWGTKEAGPLSNYLLDLYLLGLSTYLDSIRFYLLDCNLTSFEPVVQKFDCENFRETECLGMSKLQLRRFLDFSTPPPPPLIGADIFVWKPLI